MIQIHYFSMDLAEIWYKCKILDANSKSEAIYFGLEDDRILKLAIFVTFTK